jgi:glutamate/tyrosine decarboxylase-like PLP-dependent enzyme
MAYGADGYREIVEANCACAALLSERIAESSQFRLLAPVRMNVVSFTLQQQNPSRDQVTTFLGRLRDSGKAFLTPTTYKSTHGMRAAFSNWRTTPRDVEIAWQALVEAATSG